MKRMSEMDGFNLLFIDYEILLIAYIFQSIISTLKSTILNFLDQPLERLIKTDTIPMNQVFMIVHSKVLLRHI